jgi:hypothetical protein
MWISYLGWHAARREGILQPSVTWDVFRREMIADVGSPEGEASTDVPPTDQAADID